MEKERSNGVVDVFHGESVPDLGGGANSAVLAKAIRFAFRYLKNPEYQFLELFIDYDLHTQDQISSLHDRQSGIGQFHY